jgi:hypothetical protein
MLLIGSKALSINLDDSIIYNDIDLIGTKSNALVLIDELHPRHVKETEYVISLSGIKQNIVYDRNNVEIFLSDNSISLKKYLKYTTLTNESCMEITNAPLEVLYSLKKSHINFPIKFKKHIKSYTLLSKCLSGVDILSDITEINLKETEKRLGELKVVKLNKSVDRFFGQSSKKVMPFFIHDHIHMMVAHYDKPGYTYMQPDPMSVMCSKKLWDGFTEDLKMKTVLEESYVIALERLILPMIFGGGKLHTTKEAFIWALNRVCTTLCSGWFRDYATNHYFEIIMLYNEDYVIDFLGKYERGLITKCDN